MPLIPTFDFYQIFLQPWSTPQLVSWNLQIIIMGILVCWTCGLVGSFIVVRRMALMGDAISHGILPGLALAFIISGSLGIGAMFIGACLAGLACNFCIEWLHSNTKIREDAAMGLVFTSFFALGVTLISGHTGNIDLDPSCILYGEIGLVPLSEKVEMSGIFLGNRAIWVMGVVFMCIGTGTFIFYRQLLVSSFDITLAKSIGIPVKAVHICLMLALALATVASLEAVGVILVVAMFVFPSVTASFFFNRLLYVLLFSFPLGVLYTLGGFHLAHWLDCSIAGAIAVTATLLFIPACLLGPKGGVCSRFIKS